MNFRRTSNLPALSAVTLLIVSFVAGAVQAQHQGHGGPQFGVSAAAAGIIAKSQPADDAVLATVPGRLELGFEQPVRLVKLVLYTDSREWIDIDFRYNPRAAAQYSWPVPAALKQADYYSAEWAILDDTDRLVKGSFSFAVGPDAEAPSVLRERAMHMEGGHMMHDMQQMQHAEPGEIITNDQPDPPFERPFAPVLNQPR